MSLIQKLNNKEIFKFTDTDWEQISNDFESNYNMIKITHVKFCQIINNILKERDITCAKDFIAATGMPREYYSKFRSISYNHSMKSIITLCIILDIEFDTAQELLALMGYKLKKHNRVHYAYYYLLSNFSGSYIEDCNRILKHLGIEEKDYLPL